jgi:hypothetical protein
MVVNDNSRASDEAVVAIAGDLAALTIPMTRRTSSPLVRLADRALALTATPNPAWPRVALGWARTRQFTAADSVVFGVVDRAVRSAREQGDHEVAALALLARLERGGSPFQAERNLELSQQLMAIGDRSGREDWKAWATANRVSALLQLGYIEEGVDAMTAMIERANRNREPVLAAAAACARAWPVLLRGDLPKYVDALRVARPLMAGIMPDIADGSISGNISLASQICGQSAGSRPDVSHLTAGGIPILREDPNKFFRWFTTTGDQLVDNIEWVSFAIAAAHYCWAHRLTVHAGDLHARFEPLSGRHLVGPFILMYGGAVDHHLAAFAVLVGRFDEAVDRVEATLDVYSRLKSPVYAALALEVLAVALFGRGRRGDDQRATVAARRALLLAGKTGNRALRQRLTSD